YEVMKKQMEGKLLRIVEEQFPKTKGRVAHVSSGSPLTNNFYLGSVNGEVYGLNHTPARFTSCDWFLRPRTPIKGLYLAGQDILCDGIVGAMGGGAMAAISVGPAVLFDLVVTFVNEYL
ncbi:retsat, partial [Symbiodinium microadriaticum]